MKTFVFIFNVVFLFFSLIFLPNLFAQSESITLTTYYPAPFGAYDRVKLVPRALSGMPCAVGGGDNGTMYFDGTSKDIYVCKDGAYQSVSGGVWTSTSSPNQVYVTDNTKNVGIGTTSVVPAAAKLHIYDTVSPTAIKIQSAPGGFGNSQLEFWSNAPGSGQEWRPGYIKSMDAGGYTGGLAFITNGTGVANQLGSLEAMRITNGNVGIGTPSPILRLTVANTEPQVALQNIGSRQNWGDQAGGWIGFYDNSSVRGGWLGYGGGFDQNFYVTNERANKSIIFRTAGSTNGSNNNRSAINQWGYLGVGTIRPNSRLDVAANPINPSGGVCPSGYNWYDEDGDSIIDNSECKITSLYVAESTGNVGIGTNSPQYPLDIRGSSTGPALFVDQIASGYNQAADFVGNVDINGKLTGPSSLFTTGEKSGLVGSSWASLGSVTDGSKCVVFLKEAWSEYSSNKSNHDAKLGGTGCRINGNNIEASLAGDLLGNDGTVVCGYLCWY